MPLAAPHPMWRQRSENEGFHDYGVSFFSIPEATSFANSAARMSLMLIRSTHVRLPLGCVTPKKALAEVDQWRTMYRMVL
jgi:hypothetical protein